jgi:hypothetical protein
MKTYGGAAVEIHIFLASVLVVGEWSALLPGSITIEKTPPRYSLDKRPLSKNGDTIHSQLRGLSSKGVQLC